MPQYIGFKLSESEFTVPILRVREIINTPGITALPQAPHYMKGIISLRGRVIPVVDLKELVSLKAGEDGGGAKIIVLADERQTFGVLVDEITSVLNIEESAIEAAEGFVKDNIERVEGVARHGERLVILLNTENLVDTKALGREMDALEQEDPGAETLPQGQRPSLEGGKAALQAPGEEPSPLPAPGSGGAREASPPRENAIQAARDHLARKASEDETKGQFINSLVELLDVLDAHDYQRADVILTELMQSTEGELYYQIGRVTRKLHDSIKEFREMLDPRLRKIADHEVPQAVDSLELVISKTEEAANRTMGIAEKYMGDLPEFTRNVKRIRSPKGAVQYLSDFKDSLLRDLTDIMLAQEYQDVTGQSIRRVIELVNSIETELVGLITTFGVKSERQEQKRKVAQNISQDDVDDLLREFGF
jgi:chemotaxis signal transduction protein/chemotaxis regulatin CheY-phosphate phosphatase CheZ